MMTSITRLTKAKSIVVAFLLCVSRALAAEESAQPQNTPARAELQYTLVNPTPINLSTAYNTDRSSTTDSLLTGDADALQIESDELNWTLDTEKPVRIRNWIIGNPEFKLGLTNWMDVQIFPQFYLNTQGRGAGFGKSIDQNVFGDTTVRFKINFLCNEGEKLGIGLLSVLKIPTGTGNHVWERHFLLPVNYSLPQDFTLFAKPRIDILDQAYSNSTRVQWQNSVGLSHTIIGKLSWYVEFSDIISSELRGDALGTGFTYQITPRFYIDTDSFFGLTASVSDYNVFTSFSYTF
jgi:Putative MetA-pathway of phenol degradation